MVLNITTGETTSENDVKISARFLWYIVSLCFEFTQLICICCCCGSEDGLRKYWCTSHILISCIYILAVDHFDIWYNNDGSNWLSLEQSTYCNHPVAHKANSLWLYHTWVWNLGICMCVIVRPRLHMLIVLKSNPWYNLWFCLNVTVWSSQICFSAIFINFVTTSKYLGKKMHLFILFFNHQSLFQLIFGRL